MDAKSLTLTNHGLAMRIILTSLQCAPETKRLNVFPKFRINCTIAEIHVSQSYYKWFETTVHLLVKVEKRSCGIWEGFAKVIPFYHVTCSNFSGFMLQGVDGNRRQSSVFYLTASLICGGCLLVNYQKSIFHIGNPII